MEFTCSKGDQVFLIDKLSQKFEGIVKSVNSDLGKLVLTNVIQQPGYKVINNYRHFDKNEIVELKVFDPKTKSDNNKTSLVKIPVSVCNEIKTLQKEYRLIKTFDSNFYSAIKLLKESTKIGLCLMEPCKGRSERASVLVTSTPTNIFIFDIQNLGDDAFQKGLKEILENENITKIVHDCRLLSACLKHKHSVTLHHVRDVEAEDIMIVHQERKMLRKHSRSLDYLVKLYMNLDICTTDLYSYKWKERPLSEDALNKLACFVSHLIPLQKLIENKFLERLYKASDLYNSYVRDSGIYESIHCNLKYTLREVIIDLIKKKDEPRTDIYKTPESL